MEWTIDSSEKAALPPGTAIVEKEVTERIVYGCPCCTSVYDTLNVLGEHIEAHLRKNGYDFYLFYGKNRTLSAFFFVALRPPVPRLLLPLIKRAHLYNSNHYQES
ncbi:hypothetical protein DM01DRAFT_1331460 [Hesseltinella vesiculosa]|uniref:C2H2-type domain-containing protein n=1 Tax=Hesseltinella vesiculosa TaxID=101127 RepID=A0A1X2GVC3_9FUNG|nr:hypothetical protein DM01DRAFT_1331460 [Hesseltinella vesiculosa]